MNGGVLDVSGFANTVKSLNIGSGGTLQVSLGAGSTSNTLASTNAVTLDGDLTINGTPTLGSYTLLTSGNASLTGAFASATNEPGYALVYGSTSLILQHLGTIGTITATPANASIITGGSTAFAFTVQNASPAGGQDLNFTASSLTNVVGSAGPVNVPANSTSGSQSGLTFNGTAVGANRSGTFSVSDVNAANSPQTGSVAVNVFDHASTGGFTGGTITLPSVIVGYTGSVAGSNNVSVTNGASTDYRVNLKAIGGASNLVTVDGFSGAVPGDSGSISASMASGHAVGSVSESVNVALADDSTLSGANANLTTQAVAVTGNVFDHASGSATGATIALPDSIKGYSGALAGVTSASMSNASGDRVNSEDDRHNEHGYVALSGNVSGVAPGANAAISATATVDGIQTVGANSLNQTFNLTYADDSTLNGASASQGSQAITVTGNVFDHATIGAFSGGTLHLGNIHQGYASAISSSDSQSVTNGGNSDYRVNLKGTGGTSGLVTVSSFSGVAPGASGTITASLATGHTAGAVDETAGVTFTDDSSLAGHSNVGTANIRVVGTVYTGLATWTGATGGTWSDFGNWNATGGAPGLDPGFTTSDTATFGNTADSVLVDLAGVASSLNAMTFNSTGNYEIGDTVGGGSVTLAGATPTITVGGTHSITAPLVLASNAAITVTGASDQLTISGLVSGPASLTKGGAGTLTLSHANNTYSGGSVVNAGTLRTTVNNALAGGPLAVNAANNTTSAVSLGGNETVSSLSGTVGTNASATVSVAAAKTLTVNQSTTTVYQGSVNLSGTLAMTGSGSLEIAGAPTLNTGAKISVTGAGTTLKFNVDSGSPTVQSGVTATIGSGANLELAGSVSALFDGSMNPDPNQRVDVQSAGTLTIDPPTMGAATQQVGGIDALLGVGGSVVLNDNANLTANHINQTSLVIGAGSTFTLAPSDEDGNPMVSADSH